MSTGYRVQVLKLANGYYSFKVNDFNSMCHFPLCPNIKSMHKYAWDAYKDSIKLINRHSYHVRYLDKKIAFEQYFENPIIDISSNEMLKEHYTNLIEQYEERSEGLPKDDEDERKIVYNEIKMVVSEILKIKETLKSDKNESKKESEDQIGFFNDLIKKLSTITKKYFKDLLKKDFDKIKETKETEEQNKLQEEQENSTEASPTPPIAETGQEIQDVSSQLPNQLPPPMALNQEKFIKLANTETISEEEVKEILDEYCDRICNYFKKIDRGIIGKSMPEFRQIILCNSEGPLVDINIGENLLIDNIYPTNNLEKKYAYDSIEFYQFYWKPIVEAVCHYFIGNDEDKSISILGDEGLPDVPEIIPGKESIYLLDLITGKKFTAEVNFEESKDGFTWAIDYINKKKYVEAESKYTEQDYIKNGRLPIVKCTDNKLETIFGRTGQIVQLIPLDTHIEADINFGNHIVRLTEEQYEIVK